MSLSRALQMHLEISSLPRLHVNKRLNYSKVTDREMQLILQFLKNHLQDFQAGLREAAQHIGISHDTLTIWRNKLKIDSEYNPKKEYEINRMVMSPELEEKIVHEIEDRFLSKGYYFNNHILKTIATTAFNIAEPEHKNRKVFKASDSWCKSFRRRHGYVWRRAHMKKRPYHTEKSEGLKEEFKEHIETLYKELGEMSYLICNMDETSWKLAYVGELTWAKKGAKEVKIITDFNPKECFTSIATINGQNQRLPLCLIAKRDNFLLSQTIS